MEEVGFKAFMENKRRKRQDERVSGERTRMSAGNLFHRKGAVKINDLLVIRREEGLDGRLRETTHEDLVLGLF